MTSTLLPPTRQRLIRLGLLAWLATLSVDFFLHAGILAALYTRPSPFLLPPLTAFQRIPAGYLAFLSMIVLLLWLQTRLHIAGGRAGFVFGLRFGLLLWGALALGLWSITTADWDLLVGWWLGQALELAVAGAVIGSGLHAASLRPVGLWVLFLIVSLLILTVALQTLGLAPATRLSASNRFLTFCPFWSRFCRQPHHSLKLDQRQGLRTLFNA